jgi:hypothetical protein
MAKDKKPAKFSWDDYSEGETSAPDSGQKSAEKPQKFSWDSFSDVEVDPKERGKQVYESPVGPPVAAIGSLSEIPSRIMASNEELYPSGTSPERHPVMGTPPTALPGGAIPKLTQAATKVAEASGVGGALARTALSTGQGAVMSAMEEGKPGESWQDKIDRVKSGAKLSGGVQLAAESIPIVGKALGAGARKIGSALSGVDENIIKNYAARTDEVNDLIKQSGGDVTEAADIVRNELSAGIQNTKAGLNARISRTLSKASPEKNIPVQPLLEKLEAAKSRLNPNFKGSAIKEIDEMISAIKSEAPDGMTNVSSLYQIKQFLNEGSASAYNKGGQIFTRASEAARAAKDAAQDARSMLKPVAGAISEADSQLSKLHAIERRLNKNLLAAGKPDAALIAAGSGANARNAANLRELERISGVPVTQRAKDLATAKTFSNPSLTPTDFTGKAAARVLAAGGIGTAVAGPVGGAIAAGLTSPMAVKLGVNGARIAERMASRVPSFARMTRENPVVAQTIVQLMSRQIRSQNDPAPQVTPEIKEFFQENPKLLQDIPDPKTRDQLQREIAPKGEDRWAQSGLQKLGIQDPKLAAQLMQSKQGKQLLIEASDLSPNSPAMKRIKDQIQKLGGKDATLSGTEIQSPGRQREPARRR